MDWFLPAFGLRTAGIGRARAWGGVAGGLTTMQ